MAEGVLALLSFALRQRPSASGIVFFFSSTPDLPSFGRLGGIIFRPFGARVCSRQLFVVALAFVIPTGGRNLLFAGSIAAVQDSRFLTG
jgi:hypothetical protein